MIILNLSESLAKPLVMAKLNMAYLSGLKIQQNCCRPHCRCHHLGYSVPPAHHCTIWCRSTFGPCGPGLSNPTSFLRPALPMAPTTDDNARVNPGNTKGVNLTPFGFFKFFPKPLEFFGKKLGNPRGFNLWSFDGRMNVGGRPYPKLWGKYKKPYPRFS